MSSNSNRRSHGLTANSISLRAEDRSQFEALHNRYLTQFNPATPTEFDLVEEMAVAKWRQRRAWNVETSLIDVEMDRRQDAIAGEFANVDDAVRLALAIRSLYDSSHALANLSRYEARHRRTYERNMKYLDKKRKNEPSPTSGHLPENQ